MPDGPRGRTRPGAPPIDWTIRNTFVGLMPCGSRLAGKEACSPGPVAGGSTRYIVPGSPPIAHASTKAIVSYAVSHGVQATDEAMRELQKDFWKSHDLKVGLASLQANGPGAARFEGR